MNHFIEVTPSRCIGCRTCEIACVLAHPADTAGPVQPVPPTVEDASGDILASLGALPRLAVIKTDTACMPVTCHHCDDAPCAAVCPNGAISHVQNTVQVNQDRCIGCKSCVIACPYGMMSIAVQPTARPYAGLRFDAGVKARAHKCDLCLDRPKGPACVAACPTQALHVQNQNDADKIVQNRRMAAFAAAVADEARPG